MTPTIVFARTDPEREAIYDLRYRVGVRESSLPDRGAAHQNGLLTDCFDRGASLIAAWDAGQVVGTLRINLPPDSAASSSPPELAELRALASGARQPVSVTSRFVVAHEYRHTRLGFMLIRVAVDFLRRRGIATDLLLTRRLLEPFFDSLGYRNWGEHLRHPVLGDVVPMWLDLGNRELLVNVYHPAAAAADRGSPRPARPETRPA
jgi:GNAT superfamily N-acetyltransferase